MDDYDQKNKPKGDKLGDTNLFFTLKTPFN
jgi:hypothetical protein